MRSQAGAWKRVENQIVVFPHFDLLPLGMIRNFSDLLRLISHGGLNPSFIELKSCLNSICPDHRFLSRLISSQRMVLPLQISSLPWQ